MKKFLIINGPNLNLLGLREPDIYGRDTLADIETKIRTMLKGKAVEMEWFQSNLEGEIVAKIQSCFQGPYDALVINPAGYTHSSVAILDALKILQIPVIEVHLTNVHKREEFRQKRITTQGAHHVIEGFGNIGYYLAIQSQLID